MIVSKSTGSRRSIRRGAGGSSSGHRAGSRDAPAPSASCGDDLHADPAARCWRTPAAQSAEHPQTRARAWTPVATTGADPGSARSGEEEAAEHGSLSHRPELSHVDSHAPRPRSRAARARDQPGRAAGQPTSTPRKLVLKVGRARTRARHAPQPPARHCRSQPWLVDCPGRPRWSW